MNSSTVDILSFSHFFFSLLVLACFMHFFRSETSSLASTFSEDSTDSDLISSSALMFNGKAMNKKPNRLIKA